PICCRVDRLVPDLPHLKPGIDAPARGRRIDDAIGLGKIPPLAEQVVAALGIGRETVVEAALQAADQHTAVSACQIAMALEVECPVGIETIAEIIMIVGSWVIGKPGKGADPAGAIGDLTLGAQLFGQTNLRAYPCPIVA